MSHRINKFAAIIVFVLLSVMTLTSCGEKTPPHYGAFLKDGGDFIELTEMEVFGRINQRDVEGVPTTSDAQPVVALWRQETRLEYLQFFHINPFDELRYNAEPMDEGVINLTPASPLEPGFYCYYQGDPMGMGLPAWCFEVQ